MARIGSPQSRPIGAALEDNWWDRVGPESHWGITPEMRSRMNQDQSREAALESRYAGAAAAGANPVQLALMDPFRHYQRTGRQLSFVGDEPVLHPGGELGAELLRATAGRQQADLALRNSLMLEDISNRYDPISQAIKGMTSQEKERVARIKTGYTDIFGEPGVAPGKAEQQEKIARIAAEPGVAETKEKARQFDILGPTREEDITTKRATRELLKPGQIRLKAISEEMSAYSRVAQNSVEPAVHQEALRRMAELSAERQSIMSGQSGGEVGTSPTTEPELDPEVLKQHPPSSEYDLQVRDTETGLYHRWKATKRGGKLVWVYSGVVNAPRVQPGAAQRR